MAYNIFLVFESLILPDIVEITSRQCQLTIKESNNQLIVNDYIDLPNSIHIKINCTAQDQYLELKEFYLGNIKFNSRNLFSITENILESNETTFETVWNSSRLIKIDIFDKTPILYHLRWGTKIGIGN